MLWAEAQVLGKLLLAGVFTGSGCVKLFHRARFQDTLAAMELFSPRTCRAISFVLPPLEILCGILGLPAAFLLAGFLLVLGLYRLRGGEELACGCFADFEHKARTSALLVRNALLLAAALPLFAPAPALSSLSLQELLLATTGALGIVLAWTMWVHTGNAMTALRRVKELE